MKISGDGNSNPALEWEEDSGSQCVGSRKRKIWNKLEQKMTGHIDGTHLDEEWCSR
jgi:hypothetical protein